MTRKLKSYKSDRVPPGKMILRMVEIRRETFSPENKSVEVVIASQNPVERFDEDRQEVVREILMMDGIKYRNDKMQLPIVDSHDRSTVRNVLGSVRNLRTENGQLVGDATFARDEDSQIAYQKLQDGHLTDFSITATPNDVTTVQRGETASFGDDVIDGPADIVTSWTPTDASLVAAGADSESTVRSLMRSYQIPISGVKRMKDATRTALLKHGMPEDMVDAEDALEFILSRMDATEEDAPIENACSDEEMKNEDVPVDEEKKPEDIAMAIDRALKSDQKRRKEIQAICKRAGIKRAYADELCDSGVSLQIAREKVLESVITKPLGTSDSRVEFGESSDDKFANAVRDGLIQRAIKATGSRRPVFDANHKPAPGHEDFTQMGMLRLAEEILRRGQINTQRMTPKDIAMVALGHRPTIGRLNIARAGEAYHTTGIFPNLLLDAANKTLLRGYDEAIYTWSMWARQAPAVADFKNINRIRFSESPDLQVVPENHEYKEGVMSDSKETYKVEKFGRVFSVTWETVVNDDLDAISRIPQMHGNAARRVQNKQVYSVLTANALMSDGVALFASGHSNLDASGAAPSVAELNVAFTAMMTQTGLSSDAIINVQPRFLIVPAALAATVMQIVGSIADPSNVAGSTEDAARANYNSGTLNIYGPNGTRPLQVVAEPQLDGNSAVAWYLAADSNQIDTVELSFLQGEESPVLENEWDFDRDVYKYKIRQTFGVKAIDWRGLYKNPGT